MIAIVKSTEENIEFFYSAIPEISNKSFMVRF